MDCKLKIMSEYEDYDEDTDSEAGGGVTDSFAFLSKVKSNTPRARFDVHFYPNFIQLIQFSVKKEVSNRYRINNGNISDMLRLPYSNDKHIFFVLHLKRPIVGGNKSTTKYDFVVFNFNDDEFEEITLDFTDPTVRDMFDEDTVDRGYISGKTIEIFETMLVKIFGKDVTTPAKNYEGGTTAPGLRCTFWDNDEHFLYPLDTGFVNVWKYCQILNLKDVKDVRFVRSQGRFKTFDFFIYPKLERSIRRYHVGASMSQYVNCFFLEFKAIDQVYYDGLFAYCDRNKITISTNDFRESASGSSDSEAESRTQTETNSSESDEELLEDVYEVPDPHMVRCQTEGGEYENSGSEENENSEEELDTSSTDQTSTSQSQIVSQETDDNENVSKTRRNKRRSNIISDEEDSSSSHDSLVNAVRKKAPNTVSPRKRSLRIDSDEELPDDIQKEFVTTKNLIIDDSESE